MDVDSNVVGGDATSPRYDVVIKERDAEAEEGDGVRDNVYFEGDSIILGWGKEEMTLADSAMDPGGDMGANDSLTGDKDEIGLIIELEGK